MQSLVKYLVYFIQNIDIYVLREDIVLRIVFFKPELMVSNNSPVVILYSDNRYLSLSRFCFTLTIVSIHRAIIRQGQGIDSQIYEYFDSTALFAFPSIQTGINL